MEPSEAIAFLRRYNHWRRGGEMDQPHPYQIGQAIDAICDHAERMEAERELADRLAETLRDIEGRCSDTSITLHPDADAKGCVDDCWEWSEKAIAAWKETGK